MRGSKPGERRGGRKKGTPNKVHNDIRQAFALLLDNSSSKIQGWIDEVAKTDPAKAVDLVVKVAEYVVPKLARSEVTGAGGEALIPQHSDRELARRIAFLLNSGVRDQEKRDGVPNQ